MNNKFFKNFQMCKCRVKSKRIKSLQGKAIEYFSQLITFLIPGQLGSKNIQRGVKTEIIMINLLGKLEMGKVLHLLIKL